MGYTDDATMVRVDFFRQSGKWYTTEAVRWIDNWKASHDNLIENAFANALKAHLGTRLSDMDAICLEPYHEYSHPIQIKNGGWLKE